VKICQLSTYGQQCGIAEYADQLHKAFQQLGHESKVLANVPYEPVTFQEDPAKVQRVFHVEIRDRQTQFYYERALSFLGDSNILLVQYESCLYPRPELHQFLRLARHLSPMLKIVFVFHSSCIWPNLEWNLINWSVAHEENVYRCIPSYNKTVIRHGLPDWPNMKPEEARERLNLPQRFTVGSCGFGRVRFEQTIPAVTSLNGQYFISSQLREKVRIQPIIDGLSEGEKTRVIPEYSYCLYDELAVRLQACDVILLDYPSTTAAVTSGAARLAIGARRKLITSATNWFSDVPPFVYKINPDLDVRSLKDELLTAYSALNAGDYRIDARQESYVQEHSWQSTCRDKFLPLFQKILA
jgi:hypothetical protein